ncbi:Transcriptional regulatory protein btr [Rubrivivax sp. A210]|uniref:helix-turn-helix domain-containing protein n=1 Tax=Rubrivivax sp. A210 TaxID=2772301 RepID=UPI0019190F6D|nr:helix-turn-helix domain-containing protein [Rubrivivax sp. A210]CAD5375002.1 Transcriptional regulatory protein btr [Rubrivivax sp. A210]
MDRSVFRPIHTNACEVECSSCNLREICLPVGLTRLEMEYIDSRLVATRRKVARGAPLYQAGDRFESLYAVWTGFFKTAVNSQDGRSQVTGFQLGGELLGLDGIGSRRHEVDATALEDSQVCVIPFEALELLSAEVASLQLQLHRIMSREIVRNQGVMLLLGSMYAEERLAAFLLNLTNRLQARGFSASSVLLRMTREEIGSFLGLTLETVSRTFSKFQADGLLFVRNRQIRITDPVGLQQVLNGAAH